MHLFFSRTVSDGPASEEQQGCQEELVLCLVPGRSRGQGGGCDAWCHSLPARARTASGAFQGHAAGERYHFGDPVSWPKISRERVLIVRIRKGIPRFFIKFNPSRSCSGPVADVTQHHVSYYNNIQCAQYNTIRSI